MHKCMIEHIAVVKKPRWPTKIQDGRQNDCKFS